MAEGKAPYAEIHPMRAIFMIPTKPPPSFSQPDDWSPEFIDFVSLCLMKNPESRAKASELLQHEFIKNAKTPEILMDIITEVQETKDQFQHKQFTMTGYEFGSIVSAGINDLNDCRCHSAKYSQFYNEPRLILDTTFQSLLMGKVLLGSKIKN